MKHFLTEIPIVKGRVIVYNRGVALPKFVLIADWSVAHFVVIDDDNEMGHRPISYQDEFSRII